MKRVVVKIGTSSITDDDGRVDRSTIAKLCHEVAGLRRSGVDVVIVTSAAIAAGLPELGLGGTKRPSDSITLQAVATVGQSALMEVYRAELGSHDLVAGQVLLVPQDFITRSQYLHARQTLNRLLELGVVPVVNENDAIADDEIRWGDNDRIAALVANLVDAERLVLLTDTEGVLTADPRIDESASLIDEILQIGQQHEALAGGAGTVRGEWRYGVEARCREDRVVVGVDTVIARAARDDVVAQAITEPPTVGTTVRARAEKLPARKAWIAFAVVGQGQVVVDAGARAALESGKSLLAAGVRAVEGRFDPGAPVEVADTDGVVFAKGLARHGSGEIGRAAGHRSDDLPAGAPAVVIHADDLVTIPG